MSVLEDPHMTNLSPHAYAEMGGDICPVCHSNLLSPNDSNWDSGIAFIDVKCVECEATWVAEFHVVGYHNLYYASGNPGFAVIEEQDDLPELGGC